MLTDVTMSVIRQIVSDDPDRSQNSIIRDVMDAWAKKRVMRDLRKRDALNLRIQDYELHGVDTATLRHLLGDSGRGRDSCRSLPDDAAPMPLSPAHRQ